MGSPGSGNVPDQRDFNSQFLNCKTIFDMEALSTDLLSRIVNARNRARIDALRAVAEDPRCTPEEADQLRVLAALFEAEHSAVRALAGSTKQQD